jgi:hypothetical protein
MYPTLKTCNKGLVIHKEKKNWLIMCLMLGCHFYSLGLLALTLTKQISSFISIWAAMRWCGLDISSVFHLQ